MIGIVAEPGCGKGVVPELLPISISGIDSMSGLAALEPISMPAMPG